MVVGWGELGDGEAKVNVALWPKHVIPLREHFGVFVSHLLVIGVGRVAVQPVLMCRVQHQLFLGPRHLYFPPLPSPLPSTLFPFSPLFSYPLRSTGELGLVSPRGAALMPHTTTTTTLTESKHTGHSYRHDGCPSLDTAVLNPRQTGRHCVPPFN